MDNLKDGMIFAWMAEFFLITALIGFALYLISCFARYRYLRIRNYEMAWMAFIPIANIWAVVEATYGKRERINIYGWDAPAIVLKLWPMVTYVLAIALNVIPFLGNVLSLLLSVLNVAVFVMIYRDMMENLDNPQEIFVSVLAVIVRILGDIFILSATAKFNPGDQDWRTDGRVLGSQTVTGGPLSFINNIK